MQKLLTILVSVVLVCAGLFTINYLFPTAKEHIPFKEKIPFLNQQTQAKNEQSEFMQIDGQFDPRNSNVIQMLIGRNGKASFDGRSWHKETISGQEDLKAVRIMPDNSNASNWQEAIDFIQFAKFDNATEFAKQHKAEILAKYPSATWRTIKQDTSGIVYDWTVVGDKTLGDYTEVGKIMTNDTGVFHVLYLNKRTPNVAQTRKTFLTFVDNL